MPEGPVQRVLFLPDGKTILSCGYFQPVRFWNVAALAFFTNAKMLAIANWKSVIRLVDTATGEEIRRFGSEQKLFFEQPISSLCFSPDGRRLASGHADTTITTWEVPPAP